MVQIEYIILMYLIGILSVLWTMRILTGKLINEYTAILWSLGWPLIPVLAIFMLGTKGLHWKKL